MVLDVSDVRSRHEVAEQISVQIGMLDALVNNAGFGEVGSFENFPWSEPERFTKSMFPADGAHPAVVACHARARSHRQYLVKYLSLGFSGMGLVWGLSADVDPRN